MLKSGRLLKIDFAYSDVLHLLFETFFNVTTAYRNMREHFVVVCCIVTVVRIAMQSNRTVT